MKNWNVPEINELDVKLTASSGVESTVEQAGGFVNGSWTDAQFNSAVWEKGNDACAIPKKDSVQS